jgi:hypothetical protein
MFYLFQQLLGLGVILLVVNVVQTYIGQVLEPKSKPQALLLIRASIDALTTPVN